LRVSEQKLLLVARVAGAFGVRGDLRLTTYTEDPLAVAGYRLLRQNGSPGLTLSQPRATKGGIVCRAKEVATREEAEALRGLQLFVDRAALPDTDEDEFYLADLIGLAVETPDGEVLGTVKTVQDFGAGDLLEIQPKGGASWWLPFTREAVPEVRIAEGKVIAVRPAEIE
jgi:16S rRNA processing protein RimM